MPLCLGGVGPSANKYKHTHKVRSTRAPDSCMYWQTRLFTTQLKTEIHLVWVSTHWPHSSLTHLNLLCFPLHITVSKTNYRLKETGVLEFHSCFFIFFLTHKQKYFWSTCCAYIFCKSLLKQYDNVVWKYMKDVSPVSSFPFHVSTVTNAHTNRWQTDKIK